MIEVEIPSVILASEFPGRSMIELLSKFELRDKYEHMKVYHVSRQKLIKVRLPEEIFSYDSETLTLSHLTFPEFSIQIGYEDQLQWFISEPGEENQEAVIARCTYLTRYFYSCNLMPDYFCYNTFLKYLNESEWNKHPHPTKYFFSFNSEVCHIMHYFDPTKYLVRSNEKDLLIMELVNLSDNSVFTSHRLGIYLDKSCNRRRLMV